MKKTEFFEDLKEKILRGELAAGQWLVERELSEIYNISRTPIREKLRKLANLGLVEFQPSKGYQVKKLSIEEIIDIFHAREAIEGECTRLACLSESNEFIYKAKELQQQLASIDIQNNTAEGVILGKKIHDLIIETANNRYLKEFYEKLKNIAALTRNMSKNSPQIEENSKNYHMQILEALIQKDVEKSEALMREHLRLTCNGLINIILRIGKTEEVNTGIFTKA